VAKSSIHLTARKLAIATASDVTRAITRRDLCKYALHTLRAVCSRQHSPEHTTQLNQATRKSLVSRRSLNLLKPIGYGMHRQVESFNNCTLCSYCIYVFCSCLRTTATCATYSINRFFYNRGESVYCAVRTGSLNKMVSAYCRMKSVYCAVRTGSLNKMVCAYCMMKSVYCAVRTESLNKMVCAYCMMKSVYCAVRTGDLNEAVFAPPFKG
jgi:hypothetical protein